MREFKRIQMEKGQAYIRDTGISVNEVVALYLREKSVQAIFQEYESLEADDVLEALGYAIQERNSGISFAVFDMRSPLGNIRGYADVFLDSRQDQFTQAERIEFIRNIRKSVIQLERLLVNFSNWQRFYYSDFPNSWEKYPLDKTLHDTVTSIQANWPDAVLHGEIPSNLPLVRSNYSLNTLLLTLAGDDVFGTFKHETIWRELRTIGQDLLVTIERPFAQKTMTIQNLENGLRSSLNPLAIAAVIVKKHGSELTIASTNDGASFSFGLPIWKENT